MDAFKKEFISLIRASLTDENPNISATFDFKKAFDIAKENHITVLLYYGALKTSQFKLCKFKRDIIKQVSYDIAFDKNQIKEIKYLCNYLDEYKLDYCLLKGSELKHLYNKSEMRYMKDADILINENDIKKIKPYLINNGYSFHHESSHEIVWLKPGMEIEFHKRFIHYGSKIDCSSLEYFKDKISNHYLLPEHSLIYHIIHMAKHAASGSLVLKHVIDLYVYLCSYPDINMEMVNRELERMNLGIFFNRMISLTNCWFNNSESDEVIDVITDIAVMTKDERDERALLVFENERLEAGSFKYIFKRVFLPYSKMCVAFPILIEIPVLLPIFWIYRIARLPFNKNASKSHNKLHSEYNKDQVYDFTASIELMGLKDVI